MTNIKSLSEFNRNQNAVIEELAASREPLYLTRNGSASVVVMDAEAFDHAISFRDEIHMREMRVYHGLMEGYQDVLEGRTIDAVEAETELLSLSSALVTDAGKRSLCSVKVTSCCGRKMSFSWSRSSSTKTIISAMPAAPVAFSTLRPASFACLYAAWEIRP